MLRSLAVLASLVVLSPSLHAEGSQAVVDALKRGGYVIVFRHGATATGMSAPDPMGAGRGKSTSTERQLSPRGRRSAREIGGALKDLQIPIGGVYTSELNRAIETGRLISGKDVKTSADLTEAGDHVEPAESKRRAEAMRKIAATPPAPGANTVLVSHKPNLVDAFGKDWSDVQEGEASIFKPDGHGKFTLAGRVHASDWAEMAKRR